MMHNGEEVPSNYKNLEEKLTIQWNFVIQLDPLSNTLTKLSHTSRNLFYHENLKNLRKSIQ